MKNNLSTLRSRRFTARQQETNEQIIAFQLFDFWFTLPILAIEKVITMEQAKNYPQEEKILLIDTEKTIFNYFPQEKQIRKKKILSLQYIVLLNNEKNYKLGLPIHSQPVMYRPKTSDFKLLSESDLHQYNFQCITNQAIYLSEQIFLVLDSPKLIKLIS